MMISPEEAWRLIETALEPLGVESLPRREASGRVVAAPLEARTDVPATDVSAMDGYALDRAPRPGSELEVSGMVAAGEPPGAELAPATAMRIMTGAPVPRGADRVIPVEETDGGKERVTLRATVEAGAHVRKRGEILAEGATLLEAGALLTPGALALLAAHGYREVPVIGAPRVAILPTGDEVVPPATTPRPGQLRDSHTDFLAAAVAATGGRPRALGIAPDAKPALERLVGEGLESDVLLLSGGVSMGELDLVEGVLEGLGCERRVDSVAIKPGKPLVFAVHASGVVFGLPGNPASAQVCFWLFVRPALRRLMGLPDGFWQGALRARLEAPLPAARGRDGFLPGQVRFAAGEILVTPVVPIGSHDLAAYARGTALVRIPAGSAHRAAGEKCEILPLASWVEGA